MLEIYNYFPEIYRPRQPRYRASSYKELNGIYNYIKNLSSQSPLYKMNVSRDGQSFALGIKDAALALKYRLEEYSDPEHSAFLQKHLASDAPEIVDVQLLPDKKGKTPEEFFIKVLQLASTQQNISPAVNSNVETSFEGMKHFTVTIEDTPYHFNLRIEKDNSNDEVFDTIASYINNSGIGVQASIKRHSAEGTIQLSLESEATGRTGDNRTFYLEDTEISGVTTKGLVEGYQLNKIAREPKNARFVIDGREKEALGNTFTLFRSISVTLKAVSDDTVRVYFLPEEDGIYNDVKQTIELYNNLIDAALTNQGNRRSQKLMHELGQLAVGRSEDLSSCGIDISNNYKLLVDEEKARSSIRDTTMQKLFTGSDSFGTALFSKASVISLNPMDYLDKVIITYPNTKTTKFSNPYLTSIYSGMLFNSYC